MHRPLLNCQDSRPKRRRKLIVSSLKKSLEEKIRLAIDGRLTFAGTFHVPDKVYVLHRGDPEQPKEHVSPAVLSALGTLCLSDDIVEQSRRQGISDWITRSDNPLPARVMVNRIWQWHFGCGLVETSNDFGRNGRTSKPSGTA